MGTSNVALYGETGRFPISLDRYVRIVKYWLKIAKSDYENCIVKSMYIHLFNEVLYNQDTSNWVAKLEICFRDLVSWMS